MPIDRPIDQDYVDDSLSPQLKPEEGVEYYLDMSNFTTLAFQCSTNVPKLTISIYSTLQNDGIPPANCEYVKVYEGVLIKGDSRSRSRDLDCKYVKVVLHNASAFEGEARLSVRRRYQKEREEKEMPKFKEGDKVRVVAIDQGWGNWVPEMSQFMGKVFRARLVDSLGVVFTEGLIGGESGYAFPPHVLQPADIDPGFKEGDKVRIVGPSFTGDADHIGKTGVLDGEADADGDCRVAIECGAYRSFSPASLELISSKDDEKEEEGCIICGGEPDPCRISAQKLFGGAACNACVQAWQNSAGRTGIFHHMNERLRDHGFTSRDQVSLEDLRKAYRETGGFKQETDDNPLPFTEDDFRAAMKGYEEETVRFVLTRKELRALRAADGLRDGDGMASRLGVEVCCMRHPVKEGEVVVQGKGGKILTAWTHEDGQSNPKKKDDFIAALRGDEGFSFCYDLAHSSEDQMKMVETQNKSLGYEETSWLKAKLPDGRIVESPKPDPKDGWEEVWSEKVQEDEAMLHRLETKPGEYRLSTKWIAGDNPEINLSDLIELPMADEMGNCWLTEMGPSLSGRWLITPLHNQWPCILEAKKYRRKRLNPEVESISYEEATTYAEGHDHLDNALNNPNPNWPSDTGHPVLTSGDGPRERRDPYPILNAEPPRPEYDDTYWPQRHAPRR